MPSINPQLEQLDADNYSLILQFCQQIPLSRDKKSLAISEKEQVKLSKLAIKVLEKGEFQEKWEISKIIPLLGQKILQSLIDLVEDETQTIETTWFVLRLLGKFPTTSAVLTLVSVLKKNSEPELTAIAVKSLSQIGTRAIADLARLIQNSDDCLAAVQALACIRTVKTIPALIQASSYRQAQIRAIAIEALGSFHKPEIVALLISSLQDTSSIVRKEAVIALGMRWDLAEQYDLVSKIQPLLYDLNLEVCKVAAIALGRMNNEQAAEVLAEALFSTYTPISLKKSIIKGLSWIKNKQALEYLGRALFLNDSSLCLQIIRVLGQETISDLSSNATQILLNFGNSSTQISQQTQIKQSLAMSLGELKQTSAVATLEKLSLDAEKSVRLHAIAALKKLTLQAD